MTVVELFNFCREYHEEILTGLGGVAGWYGQLMKDRLQRQRNVIDAEQLENEQLSLALNRERFLTDRLTELGAENETLWRRLYLRERATSEYHSAALTAQRLVNRLEIRLRVPVTVFPDLPEFPPSGDKMAAPPAADERGEHYAPTNDPSSTCRPVGGRETATGKTDNRPAEGN